MERSIPISSATVLPGGFRNFSGKPTMFNKAGGDRTFSIKLTNEQATWFKDSGFNVKESVNPNDPADITYILQIKVSFRIAPPNIVLISNNRGTQLNEANVGILDTAEIQYADIVINPYEYDVNGRHGYSAYLKDMYVTIAENPYAEKYRNLVMNGVSSGEDFTQYN